MSTTPNVPMDDIHLKKYAANAARGLKPEGVVSCRTLSRAVKVGLKRVSRARETLNLWSTGQSSLPGAVEWLLDNHYLAVREGEQAREAFKGGKALRGSRGGGALLWHCAGETISILTGMAAVVLIRALSAHYRWNLPRAHEIP